MIDDWLENDFLKKNKMLSWNEAIYKLHNSKDSQNNKSQSYRRLVFDEICANLLTLSQNRKRIKKKKKNKIFFQKFEKKISKILYFKLTNEQLKVIKEINLDLKSNERMFRILQGDVGSVKQ